MEKPAAQGRHRSAHWLAGTGGLLSALLLGRLLGERVRPGAAGALAGLAGAFAYAALLRTGRARAAGEAGGGEAQRPPLRGPSGRERPGARAVRPAHAAQPAGTPPRSYHL